MCSNKKHTKKTPFRLTLITASKSASLISRKSAPFTMPALATMMSMPPYCMRQQWRQLFHSHGSEIGVIVNRFLVHRQGHHNHSIARSCHLLHSKTDELLHLVLAGHIAVCGRCDHTLQLQLLHSPAPVRNSKIS